MPPKKHFKKFRNGQRETKFHASSDVSYRSSIRASSLAQNISIAKRLRKRKQMSQQSQDSYDWRALLSQIPQNDSKLTRQGSQRLSKKYPKQQNISKQKELIKPDISDNSAYQNLCTICLSTYSRMIGILHCGHKFCYECLQQWTKTSTNCPCCRQKFAWIVRVILNEKQLEQKRQVIEVEEKVMDFNEMDYYICQQCSRGDDEEVLLICDACQFYCCHVYCDQELHNIYPTSDWFCRRCRDHFRNNSEQSKNASESQIVPSELSQPQEQVSFFQMPTTGQKSFQDYQNRFPRTRLSAVIERIVEATNDQNHRRRRL